MDNSETNNEINSENNVERLSDLFKKTEEVINIKTNTIKILNEAIDIYKEIIEVKDDMIDKQLQILQCMELKLKEFGFELDGSSDF
jgi:hypothetical protein